MASKRQSHHEDNDDRDSQVPGKRRQGHSEQQQTRSAAIGNTMNEQWLNGIEFIFRKVVREELRHLYPCCGLTHHNQQTGTSGGRPLHLCFMNKPPSAIFTLAKITAEGGAPLQVVLRDAAYQNSIVKEGPLSSVKIEILVLDGDFRSSGSEDWTEEQFNAKTLSPRDGKGPLLDGGRFITLENGVGFITEKIVFTDNSSWTKSGTFRLGVKIVKSTSIGADIREGTTEPVKVKDNRGEAYKKHDRPSLNDEVWRLKKIAKNGPVHNELSSHGIKTVKDLLGLYITNQASLREIIGNISRKSWDTIIEHAKACDIDDEKRHIYCAPEQSIALVFNCIYEAVEVTFDGQNYRSLESLNSEDKRLVERAKQQAYKNLKDLIPLETTPYGLVKTLADVQVRQCVAPDQFLQQYDLPIAQQGHPELWPYLCQPSTSTTQTDEATQSGQVGTYQAPELGEMLMNLSAGGQFISGAYIDGNEWPVSGSQILPVASDVSLLTPWEQGNASYLPYGHGAESSNHSSFPNSGVHISSKGKRNAVWNKVRSALKWVILHVAKRKAKHFHY